MSKRRVKNVYYSDDDADEYSDDPFDQSEDETDEEQEKQRPPLSGGFKRAIPEPQTLKATACLKANTQQAKHNYKKGMSPEEIARKGRLDTVSKQQSPKDDGSNKALMNSTFFPRTTITQAQTVVVSETNPVSAIENSSVHRVNPLSETVYPSLGSHKQTDASHEDYRIHAEGIASLRPSLNLVVAGHVDSGKSTLVGHLLHKLGKVSNREMERLKGLSKQAGKASFAYAWVLDEGEDERNRGVTIDVAIKSFSTKTYDFVILDAPGHRELVPNMVSAAVQADAAVLVVDVGDFEAGFSDNGQTKEHIQIIRAVGIQRLIVAVNKMDKIHWDMDVYNAVVGELQRFITGRQVQFKPEYVQFIPTSALDGEQIIERRVEGSCDNIPSFVEVLEATAAEMQEEAPGFSEPMATCVSDVVSSANGVTVMGKVMCGVLCEKDIVLVQPSGVQTTVAKLKSMGQTQRACGKGTIVEEIKLPLDPQNIGTGSWLCSVNYRLPVLSTVTVKLAFFRNAYPIIPGQQFMAYIHTAALPITIGRLIKYVHRRARPATESSPDFHRQARTPRMLSIGDVAILTLSLSQPVCAPWDNSSVASVNGDTNRLKRVGFASRVVLRDRNSTVGAGIVVSPEMTAG